MKATHLHKDHLAAILNIKYIVTAYHLETATIAIWIDGRKATKSEIIRETRNMLFSGGSDGAANWNHVDDSEPYHDMAKEHVKQLFPTFYKTTQQ
jgi:hypothetical protein